MHDRSCELFIESYSNDINRWRECCVLVKTKWKSINKIIEGRQFSTRRIECGVQGIFWRFKKINQFTPILSKLLIIEWSTPVGNKFRCLFHFKMQGSPCLQMAWHGPPLPHNICFHWRCSENEKTKKKQQSDKIDIYTNLRSYPAIKWNETIYLNMYYIE